MDQEVSGHSGASRGGKEEEKKEDLVLSGLPSRDQRNFFLANLGRRFFRFPCGFPLKTFQLLKKLFCCNSQT